MNRYARERKARLERVAANRVAQKMLYDNQNTVNRDVVARLVADAYLKGKRNGEALGRALIRGFRR